MIIDDAAMSTSYNVGVLRTHMNLNILIYQFLRTENPNVISLLLAIMMRVNFAASFVVSLSLLCPHDAKGDRYRRLSRDRMVALR